MRSSPITASPSTHLAFCVSIAAIVPVLFLTLAVDARRRSDSIAATHTVHTPSVRTSAIYELMAVIALGTTEVIALHAIYGGYVRDAGVATIIVLLAYAGFIIAAPWLTRAIRAAAGHPDPSPRLIARMMSIGGLIAVVVAVSVVTRMAAPWWVLAVACVPLAASAIAILAERRRDAAVAVGAEP